MECLFCKIIAGEIKGDIVFESEDVIAFRDINAQAPHHLLIIPKKHLPTVSDFSAEDARIFGLMGQAAKHIAMDLGGEASDYRLVINCGEGAGQTVFHTHMHFLAGRPFSWPPG